MKRQEILKNKKFKELELFNRGIKVIKYEELNIYFNEKWQNILIIGPIHDVRYSGKCESITFFNKIVKNVLGHNEI